jgi:hypothetical protein
MYLVESNRLVWEESFNSGGTRCLLHYSEQQQKKKKKKKNTHSHIGCNPSRRRSLVEDAQALVDTDIPAAEARYWRSLLFSPALYGADALGTLFDPACKSWNLASLDSLLTREWGIADMPGVTAPYLYIGSYRSAFAWHVEDVDLYSINYLHFGAPKVWYGIAGWQGVEGDGADDDVVAEEEGEEEEDAVGDGDGDGDGNGVDGDAESRVGGGGGDESCGGAAQCGAAACPNDDEGRDDGPADYTKLPQNPVRPVAKGGREAFEALMRRQLPEHFRTCREFLRHKTTVVKPAYLVRHGVRVCRAVQGPGEFMITLPGAYHAGFNAGFNCAEAVNFATEFWVPAGLRAGKCECREDSVYIDVERFVYPPPPPGEEVERVEEQDLPGGVAGQQGLETGQGCGQEIGADGSAAAVASTIPRKRRGRPKKVVVAAASGDAIDSPTGLSTPPKILQADAPGVLQAAAPPPPSVSPWPSPHTAGPMGSIADADPRAANAAAMWLGVAPPFPGLGFNTLPPALMLEAMERARVAVEAMFGRKMPVSAADHAPPQQQQPWGNNNQGNNNQPSPHKRRRKHQSHNHGQPADDGH